LSDITQVRVIVQVENLSLLLTFISEITGKVVSKIILQVIVVKFVSWSSSKIEMFLTQSQAVKFTFRVSQEEVVQVRVFKISQEIV
jgi:hypothetical protein